MSIYILRFEFSQKEPDDRRKCMLNQTYLLYFYIIRTGNLIINLFLFQEVSLQ